MDFSEMTLNKRMKEFENKESKRLANRGVPIIVRMDGKGFNKWTKGLQFPFDSRMEKVRCEVTTKLVEYFDAIIGYHCSDEITIILYKEGELSQIYSNGRYQKIVSQTASVCTAYWNESVREHIPEKAGTLAFFDSRAWEVPSLTEACNSLLWRERECIKNSINMASNAIFSHSELMGKNCDDRKQMMLQKGIRWDDYPVWAKRGTYIGRKAFNKTLDAEELETLPEKHKGRMDNSIEVRRSKIVNLELPPFTEISNKKDVLFGMDPITF